MDLETARRIVRAGPPPLGGATGHRHYLKAVHKHYEWRRQYDEAKRVLACDLRETVRDTPGPIPPDDMESLVSRVFWSFE